MYFLCYSIFLYLHSEILGLYVFEFWGLRVFVSEVFVFKTPYFLFGQIKYTVWLNI